MANSATGTLKLKRAAAAGSAPASLAPGELAINEFDTKLFLRNPAGGVIAVPLGPLTTLSAFMRSLLDDADAATARATLATPASGYAADLDALVESGLYLCASSVSVAAGFPSAFAVVAHQAYDADTAFQVWTSLKFGAGISYSRVKATGTWGTPRRMWDASNVLGTVSQSGGVPTGALIEDGSNANGSFVRFADGTLVCTFTDAAGQTASGIAGMLYAGASKTWTFPAAFVASPVVTGSAAGAGRWLNAFATSATQASYRQWAAASDSTAVAAQLQATGRWF